MDQELGLATVFYNIILCLGPDRLLGLNISRKPPVVAVITSQSTLNWPDIWTSIKIKHNLDSNWQLTSTVTPYPSYQSSPLPLKLKSAWQQEKWEIPPILWETEADIVTWSLPLSLPPPSYPWQPVPVVFSKAAFRLRSEAESSIAARKLQLR